MRRRMNGGGCDGRDGGQVRYGRRGPREAVGAPLTIASTTTVVTITTTTDTATTTTSTNTTAITTAPAS